MRRCSLLLLVVVLTSGLAWPGRVDSIVPMPYAFTSGAPALVRDAAGNLYIGGSQNHTIFVAKISSDGSKVLFSTVLNVDAYISGLALVPDGTILVIGSTTSTNFPVTKDAVEPQSNDTLAGYFMRLDSSGHVLYASYLNGSAPGQFVSYPAAIAADASGAAYITGPGMVTATPGALPASTDPNNHYFLVKLDSAGKQVFATNGIGGSQIALDKSGAIYVASSADSTYPGPVTFEAKGAGSPCMIYCYHA